MTARPYVDIPRPYQTSSNRFHTELSFPASVRRRAEQHQAIARELARIYDVEATTPFKFNARWSVYEENWGNRERYGWPDYRRLQVSGAPRALARYLAALPRVLTGIERLATRAARAFGTWRRSLIAVLAGHLEYEDPTTLSSRAKGFRAEVLDTLIGYLALGAPHALPRNCERPLWEQADVVANEMWRERPVDPWFVPEADIQAQLERMLTTELSIVDVPKPQEPPVTVPDTVEELLELTRPAQQGPVEHVPGCNGSSVTADEQIAGSLEQAPTPDKRSVRPTLMCRVDGAVLPAHPYSARRRVHRVLLATTPAGPA
ncbi:hypothetical protein ACH4PU_31100 [Streptomyces sp. NPDC021100]|uniref:hypothetical protein n=1 Tax=Streptomyces sp. NPDC021100 TaxID=3365114 RepID=UPI0037A99D54